MKSDIYEAKVLKTKPVEDTKKKKDFVPIILTFVTVIALVTGCLSFYNIHKNRIITDMYQRMEDSADAIENRLSRNFYIKYTLDVSDLKEDLFYNEIFVKYLESTSITRKNINNLVKSDGDESIYYITNGRVFIKSDNAPELELTETELDNLLKYGYIFVDECYYTCKNISSEKEYLVCKWDRVTLPEYIDDDLIIGASDDNVLVVNVSSGKILDSTDDSFVGKTFVIDDIDNSTTAKICESDSSIENGFEVLYVAQQIDSDFFMVRYIALKDLFSKSLYASVIEIVMYSLVVVFLHCYAVYLYIKRKKIINDEKTIYLNKKNKKLFKNIYVEYNIWSHVTGLFVIGLSLFVIGTIYIQLLLNYREANMVGTESLAQLKSSISNNNLCYEDLETRYYDFYADSLEVLATYLTVSEHENIYIDISEEQEINSPIHLDELIEIRDTLGVKAIDIYDLWGQNVASTDNLLGTYLHNAAEGSPEDECRKMLESSLDRKVIFGEDGTNDIYILSRRKDVAGLIRITIDNSYIQSLIRELSVNSEIMSADFGYGNKYYIDLSEPDNLYYFDSEIEEIKKYYNNLDAKYNHGSFEGTEAIQNIKYYVNTAEIDNKIFISAIPLSYIYTNSIDGVINGVIYISVLVIILLLFTATYKWEDIFDAEDIKIDKNNEKILMDKSFIQFSDRMIVVLIVLFAGLILIDYSWSKEPLIEFLLSNHWQKGISIFSFTMCVLSIFIGKVASIILKRFFSTLGNSVGSRGLTICRMLSGAVDIVIIVVVFAISAMEFGFPPTQLFTSMGITGAVFGLGAQSTINDILSGIITIFEGNFQVGDWIEVDGWRGQVNEIGVRTTKVAYAGDIKIFKNSSLDGIVALSYNMSGVLATVDIAYESDVDAVIKLIENSTDIYLKELPYIIDGPKVQGVTCLGESGITIRIWAYLEDEQYAGVVSRGILRITKKIFNDNGVEIPFNQLVIHTPETKEAKEE